MKPKASTKPIFALSIVAIILVMVSIETAPAGSLKCDLCGQDITGQYIQSNGRNYHPECYEKHAALRCDYCGQIIKGQYLVDHWGNKYHKEHERSVPACQYCGRLISDRTSRGGTIYGDGRHVCGYCLADAVNDITTARRLMNSVKDKLKAAGINVENDAVKLTLTDRNGLRHISWSGHADESGLTKYVEQTIDSVCIVRDFEIFILHGMPRIVFTEVIAHELMHVWLYTNAPKGLSLALSEGSCNYASFIILNQSYGAMAEFELNNLLTNPDPVYGEGFRRVKRLVSDKGVAYWLDYLKVHADFAQGY